MALKIKSKEVQGSRPQRFREGGRLFHNVKIYLEADNENELKPINLVQYELHPTFRERIQVSDDKLNKFEIKIWTYGFFNIIAKLFKKDGNTEIVEGFVKW
jgi:transcription initiation factor IIF auxiliary subunit